MTTPSTTHPRHALVTGATGFIGKHLVAALVAEGWDITALTHNRPLVTALCGNTVTVVQGDMMDTPLLTELAAKADVVFHLASYIPSDQLDFKYAEPCVRVNSLGTLQVARAVLNSSRCRMVSFGSGNTFPVTATTAQEEVLGYPVSYATYYLGSKLLAELYLQHLHRTHGLNVICLRLSSVYGPGMPEQSVAMRFMRLARSYQSLEVRDGGRFQADYVYVDDVVSLALAAAESGEPGVYNVGSGHAYSVLELAQAIVDVFPEHRLRLAVQPALGHEPSGFAALAIDKAILTWGYRPLSLSEGLVQFRQELETGE